VKEHVVAHVSFLLGKQIVFGEHLFRNSMETFNMSVSCFFFLFRSFVIEDAKSLTLKCSQEVHKKMMKGYLLIGFVKVKPLHTTSKWSGHWWKRFDGKFALRKTWRWLLCCGIRDSI
jgi:hypothetical protein